ncbi:MAG: urea ABC transporter permease subunit UrtB [Betaproteobacteria bacterium]|nr:urea ABC transporter permease subunit UrtB [Betaproteobacteria bacterium]
MRRRLLKFLLCIFLSSGVPAWAALDAKLLQQLAADASDEKIAAINKLAQTGDADGQGQTRREVLRVLKALSEDALYVADGKIVLVDGKRVIDAASGEEINPAPTERDSIDINNRVRRELASALASLRLFSPERETRFAAAQELLDHVDAEMAPLLVRALATEADPQIKQLLTLADAQLGLKNSDPTARLAAVKTLAGSSNPSVKRLLVPLLDKNVESDERVRLEAQSSLKAIDARLAFADKLSRIFSGLSLGSILLLAALGLAITYGVMGVINMAHGELLMVGAYSTFVTQTLFRTYFPGALDWYVAAAIPLAFFAAALVGILMERTVIRWLYGRPLETLLATWGLSLVLIQAARSIFGAQNVEVANPAWMSGGIELFANVTLPLNRIVIIGFSLCVLFLVWILMNRTRLGMFVRAVTQNRSMAGCVGVPTGRIDTLAFGLGAGIAGLGGVALSQIANVGPDMGQGYIVDSFMVVVLGGVGQLAGAVWAALGLGVASKFLEGWLGAVIAKILVLVFIIIFIQKRPQGLFALKGRFAES